MIAEGSAGEFDHKKMISDAMGLDKFKSQVDDVHNVVKGHLDKMSGDLDSAHRTAMGWHSKV